MQKVALAEALPSGALRDPVFFGKPHTRTYTLAEQIAEHVADAIVTGKYPPGSWLSEQELADLFGVSRGPIRDALRLLENERLVEILPRRGTMVTHLTREEIDDIFRVRACLMGLAAQLTTQHRTPEVDSELTSAAAQLEQAAKGDDVYTFLRLAYRMSNFLAETSRNARLQTMILSMARQTLPLTRMALASRDIRRMWAKKWRNTVQAILTGNERGAEDAARQLVAQTGVEVAKLAASRNEGQPAKARLRRAS